MAIERRDPLPPGRYWVFLYLAELETWQAWVSRNFPRVTVRASELQTVTPDNPLWGVTPSGAIIKDPAGEVVLFDVAEPVPWIGIGFPTIVKQTGQTPEAIRQAMTEVASTPEPAEGVIAKTMRELGGVIFMGGALYLAVMLIHSDTFTRKTARGKVKETA